VPSLQHNKGPACGSEWGLVLLLFKVAHVCHAGAVDLLLIILIRALYPK
jgi:hypothetical protein